MVDLLDARYVHVLDRVVVLVELERAARRVDGERAHRLEEAVPVLDVALVLLDRGARPQAGGVGRFGEPGRQPLVLLGERIDERLVGRRVETGGIVQRVADHADGAVVHLRQRVLVHPVAAVDLELLVHAEAEPGLEQADAVGADHDRHHRVGARLDRGDGRAVVLGADRVPDDLGDLAAELLEGLHRAERDLVAPGVVLADEGHVAGAELLVEIVAERMADLARRHRGAHHRGGAVPLGHVVGAGGIHHQRHAGLLADLRHRRALVAAQRADHHLHLLLMHQAARLGDGLVRVAGGVRDHVLDLAAAGHVADLLPVQLEAVDHVDARRRQRAGQRHQEADPDRSALLRERGCAERAGQHCGACRGHGNSTQNCAHHDSSSWPFSRQPAGVWPVALQIIFQRNAVGLVRRHATTRRGHP